MKRTTALLASVLFAAPHAFADMTTPVTPTYTQPAIIDTLPTFNPPTMAAPVDQEEMMLESELNSIIVTDLDPTDPDLSDATMPTVDDSMSMLTELADNPVLQQLAKKKRELAEKKATLDKIDKQIPRVEIIRDTYLAQKKYFVDTKNRAIKKGFPQIALNAQTKIEETDKLIDREVKRLADLNQKRKDTQADIDALGLEISQLGTGKN